MEGAVITDAQTLQIHWWKKEHVIN